MTPNPPKIIYLQLTDNYEELKEEPTWCEDRIEETDPAYILKDEFDKVVAELDALKKRKEEVAHD